MTFFNSDPSIDDVAVAATLGCSERGTRVAMILRGYVAEQRQALRKLGILASSTSPADEAASDALMDQQEARVASACSLQADTLGGLLSKLDLWFVEHLADGLDEPDSETERLIVSVRADLRRLLEAATQPKVT